MFEFSKALRYFKTGCKIQHRYWHKDYYIVIEDSKIMDSMGNLFYPNVDEYIKLNSTILESAGPVWDVYDDDLDSHL